MTSRGSDGADGEQHSIEASRRARAAFDLRMGAPADAVEKVASRALDPEHLLDREDPETLELHDAEHWLRVYKELLAFKTGLLDRARQLVDDVGDAARREIAESDLPILEAEARRLERRLSFWQGRFRELQSPRGRDPEVMSGGI